MKKLDKLRKEIKARAKQNKDTYDRQRLGDIHCYAEKIIDEIEGTSHNKHTPHRASEDYILKQAIAILDIALLD